MYSDLIHGDCFNILSKKNKIADLCITDIPYGEVNRKGNGLRNLDKGKADIATFDIVELVDMLCRITKGSIYIFCGIKQVSDIVSRLQFNKLSTRLCVWEKTNPSPMNGDKIFLSGIECCVYGKFPKATFNAHCKNTIFRFPCGRNKLHPTQKPLELIKEFIKISSNPEDIIIDPFMGSGTTCLAAKELNRDFIGIEKDKEYFEIAMGRINNGSE